MDIESLRCELDKKKKIFGQVQLSKLPDKGAKLKRDIDVLSAQIENLELCTNAKGDEGHNSVGIVGCNKVSVSKPVKSNKTDTKCLTKNSKSNVDGYLITDSESGFGDSFYDQDLSSDSAECNKKDESYKSTYVIGPLYAGCQQNADKAISKPVLFSSSDHSKVESFCANHLSFQGLIEQAKEENVICPPTLPTNSPSFLTYRNKSEKSKGIKLIEPQPMQPSFGNKREKQSIVELGSSVQKDLTAAKQTAAVSIHKSLRTCPLPQDEETDPARLKTKLMKHQRRALAWLLWREGEDPPGGIFADDMGLGKTLTLISLILKQSEREPDIHERKNGGTLVICPASILHQWNAEIVKHCDVKALRTLVYHGPKREENIRLISEYDVVLSTYNLILSEGKALQTKGKQSAFFSIKWHRVILDEAHTIKNHKSQTANWIFKLSAVRKWAVTGTPIHNDLKDLYCLLKFLQCKPFDDYDVWKKLVSDVSEHSADRRNALVKSILFRRCKDDVDESGIPLVLLPKKSVITYVLELTSEEQNAHDEIFKEAKEKINKQNSSRRSGRSSKSFSEHSSIYLVLLLRLQQCCNHMSLLKSSVNDDTCNDSTLDFLSDFASLNIGDKKPSSIDMDVSLNFIKQNTEWSATKHSSKTKELISKLEEILTRSKIPEKCVVVSQWVSMLDIIAVQLNNVGIKYHVIKGATKSEDRNAIAEDFNCNPSGPPVLLLSLKAGGLGLNLIGGNHLFLMDIHYNPALEIQACDRIHRVGQNRDVYIHKFVCANTIEESIVALQEKKLNLAGNVLSAANNVSHWLTFEDIKKFFDA